MKCILETASGTITRVKDDLAKQKVKSGTHQYAKKTEYDAYRGHTPVPLPHNPMPKKEDIPTEFKFDKT